MASAREPKKVVKAAANETRARKTTTTTTAKQAGKATAKKSAKQVGKATAKKSAKAGRKKAARVGERSSFAPAGGYPFPFFGAGLAQYFEWGSLYVWFEAPPPRSARAGLKKQIPEPFRGSVEWEGPVLHPGNGDPMINLHIYTAYGELAGPEDEEDDDEDHYLAGLEEFDGRWGPWPNERQSEAFERDIADWLVKLHREHPIAFVARREDGEAGGTKLDAWHAWSLTRFADVVLPRFDAYHAQRDSLPGWALRTVLGLVLDSKIAGRVPAHVRRWAEA
jgi:hypothetical protein